MVTSSIFLHALLFWGPFNFDIVNLEWFVFKLAKYWGLTSNLQHSYKLSSSAILNSIFQSTIKKRINFFKLYITTLQWQFIFQIYVSCQLDYLYYLFVPFQKRMVCILLCFRSCLQCASNQVISKFIILSIGTSYIFSLHF
jgi:hypothetical protein